ncbi:hypothetical protein GWK47_012528 [Chionoecetes opilio]|uniref:RNase H type-1 domain-containing protein n=1 Tax=Chionoecetes opilio TaxID=41210 RepID=A0A8J5CLU9_CHIOP|nr:hypothetical protein GWK47_012528 [Chionoecetes opilio]
MATIKFKTPSPFIEKQSVHITDYKHQGYLIGAGLATATKKYNNSVDDGLKIVNMALFALGRAVACLCGQKIQNRVMRFILGCPLSTRIVNMQSELALPPLVERIYANVTYFSVKCLHSPYLAPHFSAVINTSLDPDAPRLPLRPGIQNLVNAVCNNLRGVAITVPEEAAVPALPPWRVPLPIVTFTPTSKDAPPLLQKQLALETIAGVSTSVPAAPHIYVDGSVQADGSAACAMLSPTMEPPGDDEWVGRRLPNSSSSTFCEFHGILDVVTLLVRRSMNGVIVCDSQSALYALSSPRPSCGCVVQDILCQLAIAYDASCCVLRVYAFSHRAGW